MIHRCLVVNKEGECLEDVKLLLEQFLDCELSMSRLGN